jgi:hypothetical protein
MVVYNIEISAKVEEEIIDKKLFSIKENYGDGWEEEWLKWGRNRLSLVHQYTVFMEYLYTKIPINTEIKFKEDYIDLGENSQKKLRTVTVKTIMAEHYDEWYIIEWKTTGEPRLTPALVTGYIKKGCLLILEGNSILNIWKK